MKTTSRFLLAAAAAVPLTIGSALAQNEAVTDPVGYRTEVMVEQGFNLMAINLQNEVLAAGGVDSVAVNGTGSNLNDADSDFTTLPAGDLVVKITSGAAAGFFSEVASVTANTLSLVEDLSGAGIVVDDTFVVTKAMTVAEAFGPPNETDLGAGTQTTADVIWIPTGDGGFTRVFSNGTQWRIIGSLVGDGGLEPIIFTDALFIQRRQAAPINPVFVGHVETSPTEVALAAGFNFVSRILPVEITLGESGLTDELLRGTSTTADVVWIPSSAGQFERYFLNPAGEWRRIGSLVGTFENEPLASGVIIQRRGGATSVTMEIPESLDI